ncbi:MAG TPA: ABC transporter permease subunit [Verrucomicrobiae bacterium]|jgi:ABC-type transport system involved in multi-copper enzyme maturation permease subunit|nr:ABC transporter permease subunit [Verrucomicrobiae bacterium]
MRKFVTIAVNAFMELVRQPVFLLLMTSAAIFEIFLSAPYYFAFGDEPKLVKNTVLAVMLLAGLFGAVLSASASLAREIRSGTALAVLSKPVGRAQFLLAKYLGLIIALSVLTYVNMLTALLTSRMAFDAYGSTDLFAMGIFMLALVIAYLLGGFSNFFLRRPFVSDAVFGVVITVSIAFVVINFFDKTGKSQEFAKGVDWHMVPASVLVLFALWVLAGLALACSTRLDMIPTLAICSGLFLLGLISQYLFGERVRAGSWWASVLYTVTPNWQLFWLADALDAGKPGFHWGYVGTSLAYAVCYVGAVLAVAVMLFEDRELS